MKITDVWFKTAYSLEELSEKIGAKLDYSDEENYWEWVIVYFDSTKLDITRTHTKEAIETDTRIFVYEDNREFQQNLLDKLITNLKMLSISPIYLGKWNYLYGNEFEYEIQETII